MKVYFVRPEPEGGGMRLKNTCQVSYIKSISRETTEKFRTCFTQLTFHFGCQKLFHLLYLKKPLSNVRSINHQFYEAGKI